MRTKERGEENIKVQFFFPPSLTGKDKPAHEEFCTLEESVGIYARPPFLFTSSNWGEIKNRFLLLHN